MILHMGIRTTEPMEVVYKSLEPDEEEAPAISELLIVIAGQNPYGYDKYDHSIVVHYDPPGTPDRRRELMIPDVGAKTGKLAIMIGGDKETYEKVLPLFELMGENISYMGKEGAGQHTKMSNQILIASTMIGTIESLLYAYKAGNDLEEVINVIGKGAAGCWSINNLGPRIAKGNFEPGFFIKHFVKDMGIALKEARILNLSLPGLALAYQFYIYAMALGLEVLSCLSTNNLQLLFQ